MHQQTEQMVVVDLLTTLRRERFRPHACWQFLQRSIRLSCQTAQANPSLKASWQCVTGFIVLLALLPLFFHAAGDLSLACPALHGPSKIFHGLWSCSLQPVLKLDRVNVAIPHTFSKEAR